MKTALRQAVRRRPGSTSASEAIQRRLLSQDWWNAGFCVGLYRSTSAEPSTDRLLADLLDRKARVAVPMRSGSAYRWGWVDERTRWTSGRHGIDEPLGAGRTRPGDLRMAVVPGLAFDVGGGRLGHGGGTFDRLLSPCRGLLIGLCFESRLVEAVPMEPHDIRVDAVVTEKRIIFAASAAAKLERLTG